MKTCTAGRRSERGAVLVHTAIAMLALTAFSAWVIDYGVLWVARNQAQNAADAGALAGAIARAYEDVVIPPATPTNTGKAYQSAQKTALCATGSASCPNTPLLANPVWKAQGGATSAVQVSWTCPPGLTGQCVKVDVYRNGEFASTPLPTYLGGLIGVGSQGVRATATAWVQNANAANCMRPFSVADKWIHHMNPLDVYNHYSSTGTVLPGTVDQYVPPTSTSAGSSYRLPDDLGAQLILKQGNPSGNEDITNGWSLPVRLPDPDGGGYLSGASDYKDAIVGCHSGIVEIGDYLPLENGMMQGPTQQGVNDLKAQDPNATWNTTAKAVQNSCAPACAPLSPRIVPLAVFDMDEYQWRSTSNNWSSPYTDVNGDSHSLPAGGCPGGGNKCVRVTNILGFFVDDTTGGNPKSVRGYLAAHPGILTNGTTLGGGAAFLTAIQLIR